MALLNFTGFETGDSAECAALSGAASVQSGIVRTGTYAMRVNRASGTTKGYAQIGRYGSDGKPTTLPTSWAASFYFYINAFPSGSAQVIFSADSIPQFGGTAFAHIGASGAVTGYVNGTGFSYTVSLQTWYRMDVAVAQSGYTAIQIYDVAGSLLATIGSGTADATNPQYLFLGEVGGVAASSYDVVFDDVAIDDSAAPGKCEVKVAVPTGNSATNTAWSASAGNKWACLDELPPSATDYIQSGTTAGDRRYSATHASCATLGVAGAINGTKVVAVMWEPTSTTTLGAVGIRSGSTNFELSNVDIGTTAEVTMCRVDATDPNTSAAWTTSGVDAAEPLVKRSTSDTSNIRCKWLGLMILSVGPISTTISGVTATATAAAGAGTIAAQVQTAIVGVTATATAAALAGTVAALTGDTVVSGVTAAASAAANTGAVLIARTVPGETSAASASAPAGTVAAVRIVAVSGGTAAATASAGAGAILVARTVAGVTATVSAAANAGAVLIARTVTGVTATASAAANTGTVAAIRIVSVVGGTATATATANAGTVAAVGIVAVSGETATASAVANAGVVTTNGVVSIAGATATATAAANAGTVTAQQVTSIAGETAVSTATANEGTVAAQVQAAISGEAATASAEALLATIVVLSLTVGVGFAPMVATVHSGGNPLAPSVRGSNLQAPTATGRHLPAPRARVVP